MECNFISVGIDLILAFVTGLMAYYTYCMAESTKNSIKEMEKSRIESSSADIVVYFHVCEDSIYFVIENTGNTVAKNVVITPDKDLINSNVIPFKNLLRFDDFPPNYKISSYFDNPVLYKEKFNEFPRFKFNVTFRTVYGTDESRNYSWNLDYVNSLGYLSG